MFCAFTVACQTQPTHEVIGLTDITPRVIEPGQRVVLQASGLPSPEDIDRLTLRLSARLSRPGHSPCPRVVSLELRDPPDDTVFDPSLGETRPARYATDRAHTLVITGRDRLEFVLTTAMLSTLTHCPGEHATVLPSHSTVSLLGTDTGATLQIDTAEGASLSTSRPLRGVVLDLHTGERDLPSELAARHTADNVLTALGISLSASESPSTGLVIASITAGSTADLSGLSAGDLLLSLDGLHLESPSDFRPGPDRTSATLVFRRGEVTDETTLPLDVTRAGLTSDGIFTLVLCLLALAFALSARYGTPSVLRWLPLQLRPDPPTLSHTTHTVPSVPSAPFTERLSQTLVLKGRVLARNWLTPTAVAIVALAIPAGPMVVALDPDLVVLQVAVTFMAVGVTIAICRTDGLKNTLFAVGRRVLFELAGVVCVAVAALHGAGTRALSITAVQGGAPWRWNILRDPALLALGFMALVLPLAGEKLSVESHRRARSVVFTFVERATAIVRGTLLAFCLLGGWNVPGVSSGIFGTSVGFQMLGVALVCAKGLAWVAVTESAKVRLARVDPSAWVRWALSQSVPAGVFAIGFALVSLWATSHLPAELVSSASRALGWTTLGLASLAFFSAVGPRSTER